MNDKIQEWLPKHSEIINSLKETITVVYDECAKSHIKNARELFAQDLATLLAKWTARLNNTHSTNPAMFKRKCL